MKRISAEEISNAKSDAVLSWAEGKTLTPRDVAQFVGSDKCKQLMDEFVVQAQLDADREEMKKVLGKMNMRDVGGVEPEWALSNKDYQALK